jgi:hypothetical protein
MDSETVLTCGCVLTFSCSSIFGLLSQLYRSLHGAPRLYWYATFIFVASGFTNDNVQLVWFDYTKDQTSSDDVDPRRLPSLLLLLRSRQALRDNGGSYQGGGPGPHRRAGEEAHRARQHHQRHRFGGEGRRRWEGRATGHRRGTCGSARQESFCCAVGGVTFMGGGSRCAAPSFSPTIRGSAAKSASIKLAPPVSRHDSSSEQKHNVPVPTTVHVRMCQVVLLPWYPAAVSCLLDVQEIQFLLMRQCRLVTP